MFLYFLAVYIFFLKKNAYLCRQNEAETLFHRVLDGTMCCFPDSCSKLAGTGCCAWTRPCATHEVVGDDSSAAAASWGHTDRCHSIVSHLLVSSSAHPANAGSKEQSNRNACLQLRKAAYCQTPPFFLRQQMPIGVGSVLPVSLVRLLCHRAEAHHSLA